jgi:molybdopterin-guanine dinucleotide biosynthesis protein A
MGRPKAWLTFGPELLLQRTVRLVAAEVESLNVVAAPGQDLPALPDKVRVVRDPREGRGPLQGFAAGLEACEGEASLAYLTAVDLPHLAPGWVARLAGLIGDADVAIPRAEGFLHPLAALYRTSVVLPVVRSMLRRDVLKISDIALMVKTRVVEAEELRDIDPDLATLRNMNTPEDYRAALRRAGIPEGGVSG